MTRFKRERGIKLGGPGRKPITDKYKVQISRVERAFADGIAEIATEYLDTLREAAPETCPRHHETLCCPECGYGSQRTSFDHKAAAYAFDRIMGRPTTRTEQTLTVRFVEQVSAAFLTVFAEINELADPAARRQAFAERCLELRAQLSDGS